MMLRLVSRGPWRTFTLLGMMLLAHPAGAWYKHVASPRYHIVGRASGLLMGVRRSPYLWRRELGEEPRESLDAVSSLPAPLWQMLEQKLKVEDKPRTALERPHRKSKAGPWKGTPSKRMFSHQALPKSSTSKSLLAALRHQDVAWTPQCPPGCQEMPWRSPSSDPELLERAMRKNEQLDTAEEASIFEAKI